jgi:hypothetical protein
VIAFKQGTKWFWKLPNSGLDDDGGDREEDDDSGEEDGQPTEFGHLGHLDEKSDYLQVKEDGHLEVGHLLLPANEHILKEGGQDGQIYKVGHLPPPYVGNRQELEALVTSISPHQEVAIDVETYPIDEHNTALDPRRGKVRVISVAAGENVVGIIDTRAVDPRPLLDSLADKTLVAFNAQFDLSFIRRQFGYEHFGPIADPGVLDVVLKFAGKAGECERYKDKGRTNLGFDPSRKHFRSLKDVVAEYLPEDIEKQEQASDWGSELTKEQVEYAAKDATILLTLISLTLVTVD